MLDDVMDNMSLDVKDKALQILGMMTSKIRRSKNRKRYIFNAIYQAHRELGIVLDEHLLASRIGMEYKDISKAKSLVSDRCTIKGTIHITTLRECIPSYYNQFFMDSSLYADLVRVVDTIEKLHPSIYYNQPHIHAGILCCIHAEHYGCVVDKYKLTSLLMIDMSLMNKLHKTLVEIYYTVLG